MMRGVGVGIGPGTQGFPPAPVLLEYARAVDNLGFDHFWVNDHISWEQPLLDPMVLLSAIAAVTSQVRLGTGVYLVALRSPVATARQLASLDFMNRGRTIFGVGVGGEFEEDFAAAGVSAKRRGARTDASIAVIRRLLSEEAVAWHDEFFDFDNVTVLPHPAQERLPIVVGGRSDAALQRAASLGDGWMPYLMSPPRVRDSVATLRSYMDQQGRTGDDLRIIAHVFVAFAARENEARDRAIKYLSEQYQTDMTRAVDSSVALGPPSACAEHLQRLYEAGATDVVIRPLATGEEQIHLLRGDVRATLEMTRG